MTALRTIRIVAGRELRERAFTKGYLIGTIITVVVVVALVVLPGLLRSDGPTELTLGVVGTAPADLEALLNPGTPDSPTITVEALADRDAAEAAIDAGDADAVLIDGRQLLADGQPNLALRTTLEGVLQLSAITDNLGQAGLGPDQVRDALTAAAPLEIVDMAGEDRSGGVIIATIATVLLIFAIQGNGMQLLSGALEEKTSRVVEVLVSTARPWQMLAGKLAAMTVLALGQTAIVVASALIANEVAGAFELPPTTGAVVLVSALMILFGFLFYASLFCAAGSMSTTLEDSSTAVSPLMYLLFGAYGTVFVAVFPNPNGTFSQVLTFVPPAAPFVVPARIALGGIAVWEVVAALALTALGTVLVLRLAGRIYAGTLLAGGRMSWKAALKAEPVR